MKLEGLWEENVSLKEMTTFKVGGSARYFFKAQTEEDLVKSFVLARQEKIPVFILGGGSNLLVGDEGYRGLVIKMGIESVDWRDSRVEVGAGVSLSWLVKETLKRGLSGLEQLAAIPGTVGGAVYGNAGASDHGIGNLVTKVRFFNRETMNFQSYSAEECLFSHRESVFSRDRNKVITRVWLEFKPDDISAISFRLNEVIEKKVKTQPRTQPSAGCVFKNPPGEWAGALIDKAGLKGRRLGQAQISEKHANFIVNLGQAKSREIEELISLAKAGVLREFGIELEEEIVRLSN